MSSMPDKAEQSTDIDDPNLSVSVPDPGDPLAPHLLKRRSNSLIRRRQRQQKAGGRLGTWPGRLAVPR
jgi:hypothetical protein